MGFFNWLGDRAKDAMNNQAVIIIDTAAGNDEQKSDRMVEAATGMTPEEADQSRARAEYWAWKVLGTPVGVTLGAAATVAAGPQAGAKVAGAFQGLSNKQLERASGRLAGANAAAAAGQPTDPRMTSSPSPENLLWTVARTAMALVQVESNGNPDAVSKSGTYKGLLQMGDKAASDVGLPSADVLIGNARLALIAWLKYQILYRGRTQFQPLKMAILWKGGPGTLSKFNRLREQGANERDAIAAAAPSSWNLAEYVRRFRAAWNEMAA